MKSNVGVVLCPWREHHRYYRTTLSIMPLHGMASRNSMQLTEVVKLGPHHWPHSPCVCSGTKCSTSNTLISCIHMRWVGPALSPTSYILLLCRKLIFIYIIVISGKKYLKSKLQRCLYVTFTKSYEDLWTGSTQQRGWVGPCSTPAGSSIAWPVMH